jgi:hypothetical protein
VIPIHIGKSDFHFTCSSDDQHLDLALWLQHDMAATGGSGMAEELFEDINAFKSGGTDRVESWGDLVRVTIDREGAVLLAMPSKLEQPCRISLEELVDSILYWFDCVNPELAARLRKIRSKC